MVVPSSSATRDCLRSPVCDGDDDIRFQICCYAKPSSNCDRVYTVQEELKHEMTVSYAKSFVSTLVSGM